MTKSNSVWSENFAAPKNNDVDALLSWTGVTMYALFFQMKKWHNTGMRGVKNPAVLVIAMPALFRRSNFFTRDLVSVCDFEISQCKKQC